MTDVCAAVSARDARKAIYINRARLPFPSPVGHIRMQNRADRPPRRDGRRRYGRQRAVKLPGCGGAQPVSDRLMVGDVGGGHLACRRQDVDSDKLLPLGAARGGLRSTRPTDRRTSVLGRLMNRCVTFTERRNDKASTLDVACHSSLHLSTSD